MHVPRGPPGAGRLVLASALLFVLAIVTARLLLTGDWAWGLAAAAVPALLIACALAVGWPLSFVLVAFFAAAVLLVRQLLLAPQASWSVLLLGLVVLASTILAGRVLSTLLLERRHAKTVGKADPEPGPAADESNRSP